MIFNSHSNLKGSHALFGASQSSWLRYDIDKMFDRINSEFRKSLGTEIHEYASTQIVLGHKISSVKHMINDIETYIYQKYYDSHRDSLSSFGKKLLENLGLLPKEVFETVKTYVNDAVGFRMTPEQPLVYTEELFFGTADTISFRDNCLRIHDLKTGSIPAHIEQLEIYAALFCLEYKVKPGDINIELRIYQNNEVLYHNPTAEDILPIMDKITTFTKIYKQKED